MVTIACIDIDPVRGVGRCGPRAGDGVWTTLLHHVEKAVRPDDRICPIGHRIFVEFSARAHHLPSSVLGDRLAVAVGRGVPLDGSARPLRISVALASPTAAGNPGATRVVIAAARAGSDRLGRLVGDPEGRPDACVTVDRLVSPADGGGPAGGSSLHLRVAHLRATSRRNQGRQRSHVQADVSTSVVPRLAVHVVDCTGWPHGDVGSTAAAVAAEVSALGCEPVVPAAMDTSPVALEDVSAADAVVLVVDGSAIRRSADWASGPWGTLTRMTDSYRSAGVPVIVHGDGAGAGAIASGVAHGAFPLVRLHQLPETLRLVAKGHLEDARLRTVQGFPDRFQALITLTESERRVLFFLTEGWSAQDIAEQRVISIATARSHIRSVLRKLGVRSQLAAVAIANRRDVDELAVGEAR